MVKLQSDTPTSNHGPSQAFDDVRQEHEHCYHALRGPIWMVVPDGHIVQKCCKCENRRTIHADH